jgi:hypothetical protein
MSAVALRGTVTPAVHTNITLLFRFGYAMTALDFSQMFRPMIGFDRLAPEDDCLHEMFVMTTGRGGRWDFSLAQLDAMGDGAICRISLPLMKLISGKGKQIWH